MAGEIGHVVYGARALTWLGDTVTSRRYWLGTLFPNIRQLNVATRHQTHPAKVTRSTLVGENDFMTGLRVHAWVDETCDYYIRHTRGNDRLSWHPLIGLALKLLDDELLYDNYEDWDVITQALSIVDEEETLSVRNKQELLQWHGLMREYLAEAPTDNSRIDFVKGIGASRAVADEINEIVARLRNDNYTVNLLYGMWRQVDDLLS